MKTTRGMGLQDLGTRMMDDRDLSKVGRITQQSIDMQNAQQIQAKVRQGIKMDPDDDVHLTTHVPDPGAGTDGLR